MPKLMSIKEASKVLGITENALRLRIYDGKIAYHKFGSGKNGTIAIEEQDLLNYINSTRVEAYRETLQGAKA